MVPLWHSQHITATATVFAALMAMHCVAFVGGREDAGAQTVRAGDSLLSPVQVDVMARISATAAQASARATPLVVAAFDDPELRAMLKAALPLGASTIDPSCPATELLARFRAEVSAAEGVHAFRTTPQQTQVDLKLSIPRTSLRAPVISCLEMPPWLAALSRAMLNYRLLYMSSS